MPVRFLLRPVFFQLDWICARGCGELVRSIGVTFLSGIDFPEATFQDLSCSLQTSAELGLTVNMQNARQKGFVCSGNTLFLTGIPGWRPFVLITFVRVTQ